jgi:hypothetical protein
MSMAAASLVSAATALYLVAGLLFAVITQLKGIDSTDPDVRGGSWGFRALVTPGLVVLWPFLLIRGLRVGDTHTPHDRAAR